MSLPHWPPSSRGSADQARRVRTTGHARCAKYSFYPAPKRLVDAVFQSPVPIPNRRETKCYLLTMKHFTYMRSGEYRAVQLLSGAFWDESKMRGVPHCPLRLCSCDRATARTRHATLLCLGSVAAALEAPWAREEASPLLPLVPLPFTALPGVCRAPLRRAPLPGVPTDARATQKWCACSAPHPTASRGRHSPLEIPWLNSQWQLLASPRSRGAASRSSQATRTRCAAPSDSSPSPARATGSASSTASFR